VLVDLPNDPAWFCIFDAIDASLSTVTRLSKSMSPKGGMRMEVDAGSATYLTV
jgi:hypothetical protein